MTFGKRFSINNDRVAPVIRQTCERCNGTARILERGNRIICKACAGTGKVVGVAKRAS